MNAKRLHMWPIYVNIVLAYISIGPQNFCHINTLFQDCISQTLGQAIEKASVFHFCNSLLGDKLFTSFLRHKISWIGVEI